MKPTNIETLGEVIFDLSDIKSALRRILYGETINGKEDFMEVEIANLQHIWHKLHKIYEEEYFELNS